MDLDDFHEWLRYALPDGPVGILHELEISHRGKLIQQDFPRDAAELSEAMTALAKRGLVEKRELQFFWKAEPVKVEPQMELFAT